jgi:hypothetical protein
MKGIDAYRPYFNEIPRDLLRRLNEEDFKNLHKFISENAETWNAPNADQYIDLVLEYSIVEFVYEYKDDEIDTIGEEKTIDLWKGLIPVIKKVYEKHLKLYYALHKEEY